MNVKYINPLLESTISVLSTMAFMEVMPGKPQLKQTNLSIADVTGTIDLNGRDVTGWLAVGFYQPTILNIFKNMLGENAESIDDPVVDLVGEITNMITGSAKRIYSNKGIFDIDLARPSVVVGKDKELQGSIPGRSVMLPFSTNVGDLCLEFSFA